MRPQLSKKPAAPPSSPVYHSVPGPPLPHHRTKYNARKLKPLVLLSGGRTLTQQHGLPALPGQIGWAGDRPQDSQVRPVPVAQYLNEEGDLVDLDPRASEASKNRYRRKKANQWQRWLGDVIPKLLPVYMRMVCSSNSLQTLDELPETEYTCTCGEGGRKLSVTVVKFCCESVFHRRRYV